MKSFIIKTKGLIIKNSKVLTIHSTHKYVRVQHMFEKFKLQRKLALKKKKLCLFNSC
jgi:hypothetical protein